MATQQNDNSDPVSKQRLVRRHLLAGWIGLFAYLFLGIILETLHGIKADSYLGPHNTTRRLMWTLAHAHGTLFALVNIAFAVSLNFLPSRHGKVLRFSSKALLGGLVILPLGFFLGGFWLFGGDPGVGVFLIPVGALLMLLGVGGVVMVLWRNSDKDGNVDPDQAGNKSKHGIDRGDRSKSSRK